MKSFATDKFTYLDYTEMDSEMSRLVWECRNLPEIRQYMVNAAWIPLQSHLAFVEGLKSRGDALYFVVLLEGEFVGAINLHFERPDTAERGIYLHPRHQGKGLATAICRDFYAYCKRHCGLCFITTRVQKSNAASNALEAALGAAKTSEDTEYNFYRLAL